MQEDDDRTTFMVGFAMGLVGSLAGIAAAVSIDMKYASHAALGAAANLAVLMMLVLLEFVVPGSLFGFAPALTGGNTGSGATGFGPGPIALMLLLGAVIVLVTMGAMAMLNQSDGGQSGDGSGTFLGMGRKDIPTLVLAVSALVVVFVGGWWMVSEAGPPEPTARAMHDGSNGGENAGRVGGASVRVEGEEVKEVDAVIVRCPKLVEQALQGSVAELDRRSGALLASHALEDAGEDAFLFRASQDQGEGELRAWGYEPVRIRWSGGHCGGTPALRERPSGTFRVVLGSTRFVGPLQVTACGGTVTGHAPELTIPVYDVDQDCTIEVDQLVTGVTLASPRVQARGVIGQEVVVEVPAPTLPELDHDDPGWRLAVDGEHLVVEGVYPMSQADRARIAPGDRLISIKGQPWPGQRRLRMPVTVTFVRPGGERRTVKFPLR